MAEEVKKRSTYDATRSRVRSAESGQRGLDGGRTLFLDRGYRATTIAAIAAQAEVNADTVYDRVGRKPLILRELIEQASSGRDRAVVADERDYVKAMRATDDPVEKLAIYAEAVRRIQARMAPLHLALRDASTTE